MKQYQKLAALFLIGLLCFSLAGCGKQKTETIGGVERLFACVCNFVSTFRSHDATAAIEESS